MKCHIVVGSPKEVVSLKIMRIFNIEDVSLCVIDDADVVCTTSLIKDHITNSVNNCRKILIASGGSYSDVLARPYGVSNDREYLRDVNMNVEQYCIKCPVATRFLVVETIHAMLVGKKAQGIIFCTVCQT